MSDETTNDPTQTDLARRPLTAVAASRCGDYFIIAKIGHGGMAEIFLAVSKGIGGFEKLAVIKRLHPHLIEQPEFTEMFLDEARLAARLNHPNIVQTHDVGIEGDLPFLSMEHLEGAPLDRVLRARRRVNAQLPLPYALAICEQVTRGLHFAHELRDFDGTPVGVVHRDISPSNLYLTWQGAVKLLDFGIAKASTKLVETRTGQLKGKLAYMAPEQALGQQADRRADIWALGATLYEVVTGQRLLRRGSDIDTLRVLMNTDVRELITRDEELLPPDVRAIVERCVAPDPDDRYQTAKELGDALRDVLKQRGEEVDLAGFAGELFGESVRRQREVLGPLIENARASTLETTGRQSLTPVTSPVEDEDAAHRTGRRLSPSMIGAVIVLLTGALAAFIAIAMSTDNDVATASQDRDAGASTPTLASLWPDGGGGTPPIDAGAPDDEEVDAGQAEVEEDAGQRRRRGTTRVVRDMDTTPPPPPPPAADPGRLTLITTPWSDVYLGSRRLGTTPLRNVEVPSGSQTLTLRNPEQDIEMRIQLNIPAGGNVSRRLSLR